MDIFNSHWLLYMLEKSNETPQGRILSLFDILKDWLTAPGIHMNISSNNFVHNSQLSAYFTAQAIVMGASNPTILAEHIVLIARNAALQELNHPGSDSLVNAKKAASALILAQTQKKRDLLKTVSSKSAVYGITTSIILFIGITSMWLAELQHSHHQKITQAKTFNENNIRIATEIIAEQASNKLTAIDAATMYAKYEQMRNGTCQFPEVLQIPDKDKAIYLENVVGGKLPTDLAGLAVANSYLEKIRCNFTPMLMANSKS